MIVCSCNAVSDRDVRAVLGTSHSRTSVGGVFRDLGCAAQCGRCARNIVSLLDQHGCRGLDGACDRDSCDRDMSGGLAA
ncbi:MAG TPA: (2Fe-2S)-binding protein [Methylocystis sp.]|nr:(2Fe-2S)-binding protein [Methylocystis sp.]